jgi:glycosyltransferase involved in cell wall biosynthesis
MKSARRKICVKFKARYGKTSCAIFTPMLPISVVIIASNEEHNIERCISAVKWLCDEVVVAVNQCTDRTVEIAQKSGARVIEVEWKGYSSTKNEVNSKAKYDWILSLDADEVVNEELFNSIQQAFSVLPATNQAFYIKRRLVYNGQVLKHGAVCNEFRLRLFNRQAGHWNQNRVHEELEFKMPIEAKRLDGYALHYSYRDEEDHRIRSEKYAKLFAQYLFEKGKTCPWYKLAFSPMFGFVKNYFFRLGFLDGTNGLKYALQEIQYTRNKYKRLKELNSKS